MYYSAQLVAIRFTICFVCSDITPTQKLHVVCICLACSGVLGLGAAKLTGHEIDFAYLV